MRKQLKDLVPVNDYVTKNTPGLKIWEENWQGMMCARHIIPAGTDFTNILKGLPDDLCQVSHWGYCFKGKMKFIYKDGSTEYVGAGDIFCTPAPHNCIVEEDSDFVQFSTAEDMHGQAKLAQAIAAKKMKK
jgi:hypothetical protein